MSDNRGIPEELSRLETDLGDVERTVRLRIDPGSTRWSSPARCSYW